MPSNDERYIQEVVGSQANKTNPSKTNPNKTKQAKGFQPNSQSHTTQPNSQDSRNEVKQSLPASNSRLEQDRFFVEAASDRRGSQLADAIAAASYRKAMHLLELGYTGDLTQQAMQELADEWNSDDFQDIAMGETIDGGLELNLPSSQLTGKDYFALPSAKDTVKDTQ